MTYIGVMQPSLKRMPRQPLGKVGSPGGYSLPCCRSNTRTHTSVKHSCQALITPLRIVPCICACQVCRADDMGSRAGQAHARHYPSYHAGAGRSPIRRSGSCAAAAKPRPSHAKPDQALVHSPVKHITSCQALLCQGGGQVQVQGYLQAPMPHAQNRVFQHHPPKAS